jgi:hypothetical protein
VKAKKPKLSAVADVETKQIATASAASCRFVEVDQVRLRHSDW